MGTKTGAQKSATGIIRGTDRRVTFSLGQPGERLSRAAAALPKNRGLFHAAYGAPFFRDVARQRWRLHSGNHGGRRLEGPQEHRAICGRRRAARPSDHQSHFDLRKRAKSVQERRTNNEINERFRFGKGEVESSILSGSTILEACRRRIRRKLSPGKLYRRCNRLDRHCPPEKFRASGPARRSAADLPGRRSAYRWSIQAR